MKKFFYSEEKVKVQNHLRSINHESVNNMNKFLNK